MTEGTLQVKKDKKGKTYYEVAFEGKKGPTTMRILSSAIAFLEEDADNGIAVQIEKDSGPISKVTIPGKEIVKPPPAASTSHKQNVNRGYHNRTEARRNNLLPALTNATAPYNFIPYDHKCVRTGFKPPEPRETETFSGSITCSLEALTPLLVAGPQEEKEPRTFFKVDGKPVISGSSIKGMLRSLIEAMSFSRLAPVNKRNLYWRDIKNRKYQNMFVEKKGADPKIKAGYLYPNGAAPYLSPCSMARVEQSDLDAYLSSKGRAIGMKSSRKYADKVKSWGDNRKIEFNFDSNNKAINLGAGQKEGELVFTGWMKGKHMEFIFYHEDSSKTIDVKNAIYSSFRYGNQWTPHQKEKWKDIENCSYGKDGKGYPVFYLENDATKQLKFLGLAQMFRYPYDKSVGDLIGETSGGLDFAQRLFGTVEGSALKGRIAVSHATFTGKQPSFSGLIDTVLGQPSATCAAHYIKQDKKLVKADANTKHPEQFTNTNLSDYNSSDPELRGRKFYWHRKNITEIPGKPNLKNKLRPLISGSTFTFKLHLDGVTREELGAILLALELPNGHHTHKLGMGKSIGLGSVKITVDEDEMNVLPSASKYESLLNRINDDLQAEAPDKDKCKTDFQMMILEKLNKPVNDSAKAGAAYEALLEIKAIRAMMDYEGRPSGDKTAMMPLERNKVKIPGGRSYQEKAILPDAREVYGNGRNAQ